MQAQDDTRVFTGTSRALNGRAGWPERARGDALVFPSVLTADDRLDIIDVISGASQALDSANGDAFASMFTPDATLVTGAETEWGSGQLADLASRQAQTAGLTRRHTQTTEMTELADGVVRAVSYVLVTRVMPGPRVMVVATGTYDDEITRTVAGWRISRRTAAADGAWSLMI